MAMMMRTRSGTKKRPTGTPVKERARRR